MKKLLILVGVAILVAGAYYYFMSGGAVPMMGIENTAPKTYTASDFSWKIRPAPNYTEMSPFHTLALEVGGRTYQVQGSDSYEGCSVSENWPREENEISKVVCWWGGGGHELGLFLENGEYHVKERWIQESGGDEVNAPPNGPWKIVLDIH